MTTRHTASGPLGITAPYIHAFLLVFCFTFSAAQAQPTPLIRINAGNVEGPDATIAGVTYISDLYFKSSKTAQTDESTAIAGTEEDILFYTERISDEIQGTFEYSIPVPASGNYTLRLHFAETFYMTAGARVFDVVAEGITRLDDFDIFTAAGAVNTAHIEEIPGILVNDDSLTLTFTASVERPKVNAIEVLGEIAPQPMPLNLNAGGGAETLSGVAWGADAFFLNGNSLVTEVEIIDTDDDVLYQSERFANTLRYLIPGFADGVYDVTLHFAETFHNGTGLRVFDIFLEGGLVRDDLDIFAEVGPNTALVVPITGLAISDGILNMTLARSTGSATLRAISVDESIGGTPIEGPIDAPEIVGTHLLSAAYPNPFNPQTRFTLTVAQQQSVRITVYDLLGREVARLHDGTLAPIQTHTFTFEAGPLPSGFYLIQAQGEFFEDTQRAVLVK